MLLLFMLVMQRAVSFEVVCEVCDATVTFAAVRF